jgi:hypothetical protein
MNWRANMLLAIVAVTAVACTTQAPVRRVSAANGGSQYQVSCHDARRCVAATGDTCPRGYMVMRYSDPAATEQPMTINFVCSSLR